MRVVVCFLSVAILAACGADSGLAPLPTDQVRARFPRGGVVNAIEVDAVDRLPLRSVELIAPDGEATLASYLHVEPTPTARFDQRVAYAGTSLATGNNASAAAFSAEPGGAPQTRARLLTMFSTASIPVRDEVAYRRDWRSYRIFLS